jgi:methionine-rich copper-binding protein CopC
MNPSCIAKPGVFLVAIALGALLPGRCFAHARVVDSKPKQKEVLTAAPSRVEIWLNEIPAASVSRVEVFPAAEAAAVQHNSLTQGAVMQDAKDRTHLTIDLLPLQQGNYIVEWSVLSRDGHPATGRFTFTLSTP